MRSRHVLAAGLAAASLIAVTACGSSNKSGTSNGSTKSASGSPIVIGIDADTTGPGAAYDIPSFNTIKATIKLVNSSGGVMGHPLKLIQGNDESDATKTPAVLAQLKNEGAKFLLSQTGISTPNALVQRTAIPFLVVTGVDPSNALPPDNTYGYVETNPLSQWGPIYCGAFKAAGVSNIAVLSDDTATIKELNGILFAAMNHCVNVVDEEVASFTASDLTAPITRIKGHNPQAVWVTSGGGPFEVLAFNQLAQIMPKTLKFTLGGLANEPTQWKLANPGALDGVVGLGEVNPNNPQTKKLTTFLRTQYGSSYQPTGFDAEAYDAVMLIKQAIIGANGNTSPAALNTAMQHISHYVASDGAPGYYLSFSPTKHTGYTTECGIVLVQFGKNNLPNAAWSQYQPPCTSS